MSIAGDLAEELACQPHFSLRWNNHKKHILEAFEELLHAELLVDVTLVCAETSIKAHKVVLSACSPFFEKLFAEHPCKHPLIVLKDYSRQEIGALVDFMYRGEISVEREDLPALIRAAESLKIRGLAGSRSRPTSRTESPNTDQTGEASTPEAERQETVEEDDNVLESRVTPTSRDIIPRDQRLPHMNQLNFSMRERDSCGSPLMARRKQARPRRRSGELVPQDLSRPHPPASPSPTSSGLNLSNNQHQQQQQRQQQPSPIQQEDIAENLSMRKSVSPLNANENNIRTESEGVNSPRGSPLTGTTLRVEGLLSDLPPPSIPSTSGLCVTPPNHQSEYLTSLGQLAPWLPNISQSHHAHHPREDSPQSSSYPYQQVESATTSRRSVAVFPMDGVMPLGGAAGLFPHGNVERGSVLADIHDSFQSENIHGLFRGASLGQHQGQHPGHHSAHHSGHHSGHHSAHHSGQPGRRTRRHRGEGDGTRRWNDHGRGVPAGRPKGQHSAPRGGPPRSWTNAELTEALQQVWNKNMTTSQASRVFGIPYNSLLMYVRGKYGKSLKLEQLRLDCIAAAGEMMNSLNNNVKAPVQPPRRPHPLPTVSRPVDDNSFSHHSLLTTNVPQGYFQDFTPTFPVPVNMVHIIPPSEQRTYEPPNPTSGGSGTSGASGSSSERTTRSRSSSPVPPNHESIPEPPQSAPSLLQQNGPN